MLSLDRLIHWEIDWFTDKLVIDADMRVANWSIFTASKTAPDVVVVFATSATAVYYVATVTATTDFTTTAATAATTDFTTTAATAATADTAAAAATTAANAATAATATAAMATTAMLPLMLL